MQLHALLLLSLATSCGGTGNNKDEPADNFTPGSEGAISKKLTGTLTTEQGSPDTFKFGVISHPSGPLKLYSINPDGSFVIVLGDLKETDQVSFALFDRAERLLGYLDFDSAPDLQGIVGLSGTSVALGALELRFALLEGPRRGNLLVGLPFGMEVVASGGAINDLASAVLSPKITPSLVPPSADVLLNGFYRSQDLQRARQQSTALVVSATATPGVSRVWVEQSTNNFAKTSRLNDTRGKAWIETGFELVQAASTWTATIVPSDSIGAGYLAQLRYRTSTGATGGIWREIEALPSSVPKLVEAGFVGTATINYSDETARNGLSRPLCATAGASATLVFSGPQGLTGPFGIEVNATHLSAEGTVLAPSATVFTAANVQVNSTDTVTLPGSVFVNAVGSANVAVTKITTTYTASTGAASSFVYFAYCP